jgi:hypothetical protein
VKESNGLMLAVAMLWLGLWAGENSDGGILGLGLWATGALLLAELTWWLLTRGSRRRVPPA